MRRWNVQYVYKDETGKTRVSVSQVIAATADHARRRAAATAPAKEFVLSVQVESDDQALGSVRRQAMILAGKVSEVPEDAEESEGFEDQEPT